MNDAERATGGRLSVGDVIVRAERLLDGDADLSIMHRVVLASVILTGGDSARPITFGEVADRAGVEVDDALLAYAAIGEQQGIDDDVLPEQPGGRG